MIEMIEELKNSKEIVFHKPSGNGYYVTEDHEVKSFSIFEMNGDVKVLMYLIEHGKEIEHEYDIQRVIESNIYEYFLYNNGDYEFAETTSLYSLLYFTKEEFEKMCKNAQAKIISRNERENDIYNIKRELENLYPKIFFRLARGQGFNSYEWEDSY